MRDLPRLSVDIDLAYVKRDERAEALAEIDAALGRMAETLGAAPFSLRARVGKREAAGAYGLMVGNRAAEIKIEVSPVLRGLVYPEVLQRVAPQVEATFGFAEVPLVSFADLYAGKIVAALDRQHPRDLFDVKLLLAQEGISEELFRAFFVYLISGDDSIARIMNPARKPLHEIYERQFVGMTAEPVLLTDLEQAREDLIAVLHSRLSERDKTFLMSFKRGAPEWDLLGIDHAPDLPAVRWKLQNVLGMTVAKRNDALNNLERVLENIGKT